MSTTTRAIVAHADIAHGLRVIAQMFDQGDMPASYCAEQAETFHYYVASPDKVREIAARLGVEVDVHEARDGAVHTSFSYPIGKGTRDPGFSVPAYAGAVVLEVAHMSEAVSA